jgi:hypothetical protein
MENAPLPHLRARLRRAALRRGLRHATTLATVGAATYAGTTLLATALAHAGAPTVIVPGASTLALAAAVAWTHATLRAAYRPPLRLCADLDAAYGSDGLLATAFETSLHTPPRDAVARSHHQRLWAQAEAIAAAPPPGDTDRAALPNGALALVAALLLSANALTPNATARPEHPAALTATTARDPIGAVTAPDTAARDATALTLADAADDFEAEALARGDAALQEVAEALRALARELDEGTIERDGARERLDGIARAVTERYAASPVRRESYVGALVDQRVRLSAEVDGIGDHRVDQGRPEVAGADRVTASDQADVHVPEDPNFRRRGVADDQGGGPGEAALDVGREGFIEANVNLERTTTVGFDFDELATDVDAIRSQLRDMAGAPTEGMRAIAGAGGDGDAGNTRNDAAPAATRLDLADWATLAQQIVTLPEATQATTRRLQPPKVGSSLARTQHPDDGATWQRAAEPIVSAAALSREQAAIAERYLLAHPTHGGTR